MSSRKLQAKEIIIIAILIVLFVVHSYHLDFTQDDAYISYRYVENFLEGHGLVFNYGERVEGYTNFLWIMLLSLAMLAGLPIIAVSKVLGVMCGAGTVFMTFLICREFSDHRRWYVPLLAAAFMAANGAFCYWVIGGLETGLFIFLFSLAIYAEFRRPAVVPFILILATLTRPEGGLLFGIIFLYRWLIVKQGVKELARYVLLYFGLLAPYIVFKLIYFGDLLPNPFYAKTGMSIEYFGSGLQYFGKFAYHYGLFGLFFLMPVPFLKELPNKIKLSWLCVVVYSLYIILVGGDVLKVHRFFLPIMPLFFCLFAFLIWKVLTKYKKIGWLSPAVILIAVGYIVWSFYIPLNYITSTRFLERNFVDKMNFVVGELLKVDQSDFSLATTTIGKSSYMLKGHKVIDMLGLTDRYIAKNPESIEGMSTTWKERNFNSAYLLEQKPDYILFSTGHKASAPAERALLLNSHFRRNYRTIGFIRDDRGFKVVWKKYGDFSEPNEQLPTTEFADHMYDGLNFSAEKRDRRSVESFKKAAELCNHDFALLEFFIGQQYSRLDDMTSAVKHFDRALEIDPYQVETLLTLYRSHRNMGDQEGARTTGERLRKVAPWLVR